MIDLHLHLDGSLTARQITELAQLSQVTLPVDDEEQLKELLSVNPGCKSLGEYLEKFTLPLSVLQTNRTVEQAVYLLQKRLARDGLCYAEIRFAPQLHTKNGISQREIVAAACAGLRRGVAENKMPAQLILCCMRGDDNQRENLETVRIAAQFFENGVCAVDLAGNEAAYSTDSFEPVFALARELKLPFTIHAGEAAGAESVQSALRLGAKRIGHGIRSRENPELMAELKDKKVTLETCVTSNLHTKSVSNAGEHPLPLFLAAGISATINTDNMTVSDTTLKKEYLLAKEQFSLDTDDLKQLALNAADGAFVSDYERAKIKGEINSSFTAWLFNDRYEQ